MYARLRWTGTRTEDATAWSARDSLYAYAVADPWDLLYIGKAVGCTVRGRLNARDKDDFCGWAEEEGITGFSCFIARPQVEWRLSPQLLYDIERLLIFALKPPGNVQGVTSYDPHPGLSVSITGFGQWPKELHDCGGFVRVVT